MTFPLVPPPPQATLSIKSTKDSESDNKNQLSVVNSVQMFRAGPLRTFISLFAYSGRNHQIQF